MAKRKQGTDDAEPSTSDVEEVASTQDVEASSFKGDERQREKFNKQFKIAEQTAAEVLGTQICPKT